MFYHGSAVPYEKIFSEGLVKKYPDRPSLPHEEFQYESGNRIKSLIKRRHGTQNCVSLSLSPTAAVVFPECPGVVDTYIYIVRDPENRLNLVDVFSQHLEASRQEQADSSNPKIHRCNPPQFWYQYPCHIASRAWVYEQASLKNIDSSFILGCMKVNRQEYREINDNPLDPDYSFITSFIIEYFIRNSNYGYNNDEVSEKLYEKICYCIDHRIKLYSECNLRSRTFCEGYRWRPGVSHSMNYALNHALTTPLKPIIPVTDCFCWENIPCCSDSNQRLSQVI